VERDVFIARLHKATQEVLEFTQPYVVESLPDAIRYLVSPHASYAGRELGGDEEIFPEDVLPEGQEYLPILDAEGVAEFLWRGGKLPGWINIGVKSVTSDYAILRLVCCTQFTAGAELFAGEANIFPFLVKGPAMPADFLPWFNARRGPTTMDDYIAEMGKIKLPPWEGDLSKP
jgi:hypothetical protein